MTGKRCKSPQERGLRITFDHHIRWRDRDFALSHGSAGAPLLHDDTVLMEIKACGNLPKWLSDLLAAEKVYPSSFSQVRHLVRNRCICGKEHANMLDRYFYKRNRRRNAAPGPLEPG